MKTKAFVFIVTIMMVLFYCGCGGEGEKAPKEQQVKKQTSDQKEGIDMAKKILSTFDNAVTEAMVKEVPVIEYYQGYIVHEIESLWQCIIQE